MPMFSVTLDLGQPEQAPEWEGFLFGAFFKGLSRFGA